MKYSLKTVCLLDKRWGQLEYDLYQGWLITKRNLVAMIINWKMEEALKLETSVLNITAYIIGYRGLFL